MGTRLASEKKIQLHSSRRLLYAYTAERRISWKAWASWKKASLAPMWVQLEPNTHAHRRYEGGNERRRSTDQTRGMSKTSCGIRKLVTAEVFDVKCQLSPDSGWVLPDGSTCGEKADDVQDGEHHCKRRWTTLSRRSHFCLGASSKRLPGETRR